MTRGRTAPQLAADVAGHAGGAVLIEMLFDSGTLRLTTSPWPVVVGGNTYTATGLALSIGESQEAAGGAEGAEFTMTGLDSGVFDLVVAEPYNGRVVRLLQARFDANDQPVEDPAVWYVGRMRAMTSTEVPGERKHTVQIQTEHYDAELSVPRVVLFSDAEQRRRYPADTGLQYVAALVDRTISRKPKV